MRQKMNGSVSVDKRTVTFTLVTEQVQKLKAELPWRYESRPYKILFASITQQPW